jgi:AcrR family transcriptional regulator
MRASDVKPQPGRPRDDALAVRRRDEILHHSIRHFARDGYFAADLDALAADIGCAKGTLYRYFDSKAELFQASVDLVMRELIQATRAFTTDDPLGQLEFAIRSYFAYFDQHPEYVELLIQERAAFRDRKQQTYFVHRDANVERWTQCHLTLMDQGRMRRMPVERVHAVIGDLLYGTIFTNYFSGTRRPLDQQTEDVLDVLFNGLLSPEEIERRRKEKPPGTSRPEV